VYSLYATVTCSTPSPSPFPLHAKVSERSTRCLTTEALLYTLLNHRGSLVHVA
jgi:hypothetical protein